MLKVAGVMKVNNEGDLDLHLEKGIDHEDAWFVFESSEDYRENYYKRNNTSGFVRKVNPYE